MNIPSVSPRCKLSDLVLPSDVLEELRRLLEEGEYETAFREHGVPVRKKILLHGPSGCGKTSIAHALADELQIKVATVQLSETVGSHLGESQKNVASALQYAAQNRCVLLIDEFDAIGAVRDEPSSSASKSLNQVVNTLLMDLETKIPLGLIIACTNFYQAIDPALIRRFDLILEVPSPSREALFKLAESVIRGRFGIRPEDVLALASTPATVVARAYDLLRKKIIASEKSKNANTLPLFDEPAEAAREIRKRLEKGAARTKAPAMSEATP
jgi:SpoVK/Ycf46/Vps4 family AAA+-type ATPase